MIIMLKKGLRYIGQRLIEISEPLSTYPNLQGDRDIENSFIAANLPYGPGEALDFGTGGSNLGLIAARKNFHVTSIDLNPVTWPYYYTSLSFLQADVLHIDFPEEHFDLIISCSTVEHVGLSGRYNISQSKPNGDIEAMGRQKKIMKSGGCMLLTIPVGKDAVFMPLHRIYGKERLPQLLSGYIIKHEEYWIKNDKNIWVMAEKNRALEFESQPMLYGLGCFLLEKE